MDDLKSTDNPTQGVTPPFGDQTIPKPTPPEPAPTTPLETPSKIITQTTTTVAETIEEKQESPTRFPKSPKKKIIAGVLSIFMVVLGGISVATAWKLGQIEKVTPEEAEAWIGPACSGDCEIVVGPGNLTFEAAGHGFRWHCLSKSDCELNGSEVKSADIYVPFPTGATVKEAYAIWSGEGCHTPNEDCAAENQTTVNVNGHNAPAIKTFVAQNPKFADNTQAANIAKLNPASIPSPAGGTLKFHVLSLGNFYANGHGMSIIVIYEKQGVGYNKIILRLWGEWLYLACFPYDTRPECPEAGARSKVMSINLPDFDTTRANDNKFAWFAGEGELNSRDTSKKFQACVDDIDSSPRASHLYYQTPGHDWTILSPTDSPPAPFAWFACPMDPGAWWVSRVTGVNMPKINLTGNSIKFAADSAYAAGESSSMGESYTFVGAVAQYPVAEPTPTPTPTITPTPTPLPGCWGVCEEDPNCPQNTTPPLVCRDVQGTKRCVNPGCPTEQNCTCPPLLCLDLTADKDVTSLEEGDVVRLTCKGSSGIDHPINHVEFRTQINGGSWTNLGTASVTKTDGEYLGSKDYTIPQTGDYRTECRVCTSTDAGTCTIWGKSGVSLP